MIRRRLKPVKPRSIKPTWPLSGDGVTRRAAIATIAAAVREAHAVTAAVTASTQDRTVGALGTVGPPTPEQIALRLPIDNVIVPATAIATCRYKRSDSSAWKTGHPLFRVMPYAPPWGPAADPVFAWPIIGLEQGTTYDVEVTVEWPGASHVRTLTHTTRTLPAASGAATKTANSVATLVAQVARLVPGDVLEIDNGTYGLISSQLFINCVGTEAQPIYIRGASREGVILSCTGSAIQLRNCAHVVFEDFTIQGSGVDSGTAATGTAFNGANDTFVPTALTIRRITATGIDRFVYIGRKTYSTLVYDCTATGNNLWNAAHLMTALTWNDDGIHLPGEGNCGFQNTLSGFGDTFAYCSHDGTRSEANAIHYYRNEVRNSCDDAFEADHARMNCTFYDNRVHNTVNASSFDPLVGGPFLSARNIYINLFRGRAHKWNSGNRGQFLYNNTIISTLPGSTAQADRLGGWYQPNNGPQAAFGFRNNLTVYSALPSDSSAYPGKSWQVWMECAYGAVDWSHNAWAPDARFRMFNTDSTSLAHIKQRVFTENLPTTPIFSGQQRFHEDVVTVFNIFTPAIKLPATSATAVEGTYYPQLASGTAKNTGVVIPNITDGYLGSKPDRGAVIQGRTRARYGDQSAWPAWRRAVPTHTWAVVPSNRLSDINPANNPLINPDYSPSAPGESPWKGVGGQPAVMNAYNGAAWDQDSDTMYIAAAGGHTDYAGNEVYRITLRGDAPVWEMIAPPTGCIGNTGILNDGLERLGVYFDGRIRSHHTLGSHAFVPGHGVYIPGTIAPYRSGDAGTGAVTYKAFMLNSTTGEMPIWSEMPVGGPRIGSLGGLATAYDPLRGCLWLRGDGQGTLLKVDVASRVQTLVGGSANYSSPGQGGLRYLPEFDALVGVSNLAAGYVSSPQGFMLINPATGTHHTLSYKGSLAPGFLTAQAGITWDGNRLLLWHNATNLTLISTLTPPRSGSIYNSPWVGGYITPVSGSVTPSTRQPAGTYGRFRYSRFLRGVFLVNNTSEQFRFFALE